MEAEQLAAGDQLLAGLVSANAMDHSGARPVLKLEMADFELKDSVQSFGLKGQLEKTAACEVSRFLTTVPLVPADADEHSRVATVVVAVASAASQVADASLSQATRDIAGSSRAGADQDELHLQECQQKDEDEWSCCPNSNNNNNNNNIGLKKDAEIGSDASGPPDNGANSDEHRRILNDTFAAARDEEPDQAGRRRLDDLGADEAIDLGAASSRAGVQVEGRRAGGGACDQGGSRLVAGSFAQRHGGALNKVRSRIRSKQNPLIRSNESAQSQKTMIEEFARYQVASHLDALAASLKLASDASDDETNLLSVLQRLGEWRTELRIVDNQLFELMSECFARLGSKPNKFGSEDKKQASDANLSLSVDLTPIDLTQTNQVCVGSSSEKRVKMSSPGINFKKMRLLGATRDEQPVSQPRAIDLQQTGNTTPTKPDQHKTDESDDQSDEKPELKKFYSIGTAEISREQFNRQQQMFDLTLAKLAKENHKLEATSKCVTFELTASQNQEHEVKTSQLLDDYSPFPSENINNHPLNQTGHDVNYQNYECMRRLAMTATSSNQELHYQAPPLGQIQSAQNPTDQFNLELSHMSIIQTSGQIRQNNHSLNYPNQPQDLVALNSARLQDHSAQSHYHQQYQRSALIGAGNSAFDNLLRNSTNICKDLVPIVRKMAFKCHVCQSCFEDRHRLQQHLSIHLNLHPSWFEEKTIKETMTQYELRRGDYLCHICKVRYETTAEFDKHMHLHGDKPHQCNLCSRESKFVSFRYFRQLLTHLRSHCFLYSCKFAPECRQTANRKDYLKLHILKHHLNNKLPEQYTICCH